MSGKYNHKAIFGEVILVEGRTIASTGKFVAEVRVRTDEGKVWRCTLWEELAEKFVAKNFLHLKVNFEGNLKNENEINVKFFDGDGSRTGAPIKKLTEEESRIYQEYLDRNHMVVVDWEVEGVFKRVPKPKKGCVKVSGRWQAKIEYVMQVLGATEVTKRLRDFDGKLFDINAVDYNRRLDEMLEDCMKTNGELVEIWI